MINEDIEILDVKVSKVVSYLFQGYSIIPDTLIVWED
jgi:hypothetical protein